MKEIWLSANEFAKRMGWTPRHLNRKRHELKHRKISRRARNGRPQFEYSCLNLPAEEQMKLASQILSEPAEENLTVNSELRRAGVNHLHLTPQQEQNLAEELKLIAPLRDFEEGRAVYLSGGRKASNKTEIVEWLAASKAISEATIWRRYSEFKQGSVTDLVRVSRSDRGVSHAFDNRGELKKFVLAKWKENCGYSHIADIVRREWGGRLLPYNHPDPPGRGAIKRFIDAQFPKSVQDCARLPKQVWEAKHAPHLVTGRGELTRPNQVWVADHRLFDVLVRNDCFPGAPRDAAIRLWQTAIQDMRTRVIVGSAWSADPSWRSIASALKQGIGQYGVPEIFYADNGKDFRKVGAGAVHASLLVRAENLDGEGRVHFTAAAPPRIPGLLARLNIKVCYCTPRHPQAKQIESYFNFVSLRFDRLFFGHGYTGSKPEYRPDLCRELEKEHKDFLSGKRKDSPLIGAKDFIRLHAQWLEESNTSHSHSGRGMNGRAPMEVMDELLPQAARQIPAMAELAPLFWDVQERTVINCKVQLNNTTYSAIGDPQDTQNMYLANRSEVAVYCDPHDMASALAFENVPNGRFLARLVSDDLAAQKPITEEEVKAMMRQRAKLRKSTNAAIALLTSGVPSEVDLLSERSDLEHRATGTDGTTRPLLPARATHTLQPAIVSVAVEEDRRSGIWDHVEQEED